MIGLHAKFLEKDGEKAFAVLPFEEFLKIQERLEDYEDLLDLRKAKEEEGTSPGIPLEEAKKQWGL